MTEDLEFLRDGRERFRRKALDSLYQSWRKGGLGESELRAEVSLQKPERAVFFETYLMNGLGPSPSEFAEQGDRCMKDTDHPSVHRLVQSKRIAFCPRVEVGACNL